MSDFKARSHYRHFTPISTRWHDNDVYGHVNNVVYYGFFDSAVNRLMVEQGGLNIHEGGVIALVVSSDCEYFASVAFPQQLEVGLLVEALGRSSVRYQLAVFVEGQEQAVASGHFVHVFVDRHNRRPVPVPVGLREVLYSFVELS
ncbi:MULTISPECIES: acyl-CoA thioesterase [Pseudomonas]|jgi:acyl-CoA thioester hydrolase|uniref:Thioesterase superfamily protein n=1 Tax=Pseudomonas putida (strain DOT-T1E) TaxID=1196325 RepID=I7CDD7_PSEPT|nr:MULTISPECIES: thioesterase family protein [Pseudomonas]HBK52239.1 acyl-CoA thioesterase [Pseudomonas sp.]AFO51276.1 thioesterase superfamily protein [Pseudomonas putida DOT-T1E]AYN10749.1 thioesterase [Pseudomonas putida]MDW2778296.1 thioesterase family protein [Pseudomonas sp. BEA3.1]RIZ40537.1 thioesterase [Pseudomonas putida]